MSSTLGYRVSVTLIHFRVSLYEVFRIVVISSFGKLSALAAMVWTGDFYLWLPAVLVLPAHFQAYRGKIISV